MTKNTLWNKHRILYIYLLIMIVCISCRSFLLTTYEDLELHDIVKVIPDRIPVYYYSGATPSLSTRYYYYDDGDSIELHIYFFENVEEQNAIPIARMEICNLNCQPDTMGIKGKVFDLNWEDEVAYRCKPSVVDPVFNGIPYQTCIFGIVQKSWNRKITSTWSEEETIDLIRNLSKYPE